MRFSWGRVLSAAFCCAALSVFSAPVREFIPSRKGLKSQASDKLNQYQVNISDWSLDEKIGQLLIVGYRHPKQIQNLKVGGIVIFAWNLGKTIEDTYQLIQKTKNIASQELKVPLFISTDQEGGRVLRIRRGMTHFPDAAAIGAVEDPFLAFKVGKHMGLELKSLGLNMNFAPVLDMGNARSFLGNRVWGDRANDSVYSAVGFMRGLEAAGVLAVTKHFPGHGRSSVDSHFALPKVDKSLEQIMKSDLLPFKEAIAEGAMAMMTAHVEYPQIAKGPASLSPIFLDKILRKKMGFKGLIITDDLEMDGVKIKESEYGDLALKALKAGSDMILLVWSQSRQKEIFSRIRHAVQSGEVSEKWLDEKVKRILRVKAKSFGSLEHKVKVNPLWKQNLRTQESLNVSSEVTSRAIKWWLGNAETFKDKYRMNVDRPWRVYVPRKYWKRLWKRRRPDDEVYVYSQVGRQHRNFLANLKRDLKSRRKPTLLFTPPRHNMNEDLFQSLKVLLGKAALAPHSRYPALWIHQGMKPLRVKQTNRPLSLGIVSIFSTSPSSFREIQDVLESPKGIF